MAPVNVAHVLARFRRREFRVVALQPAIHVPQINLLAPKHSGEGLALDHFFFRSGLRRMHRRVELVGFCLALSDDLIHLVERGREFLWSQA